MRLNWTDIYDIALALEDKYPHADVQYINFTDLWLKVTSLPEFIDDPKRSNEKILEAIQMAWLKERL